MSHEARLKQISILLPPLPQPKGTYQPGILHNGLLYLSGQGPVLDDGSLAKGVVGGGVTVEQANFHAKRTGLVLLAAARQILGLLDGIERVINVFGMVNGAPSFSEHPKVINGCSDLFIEVFGQAGRHARAAVGLGTLPESITVEIAAIFGVKP